MKIWLSGLSLFTFVLSLAVSCTPKVTTSPVLATQPAAKPLPSGPAAPVVSPDEVAWSQVEQAAKKEGKLIRYGGHLVGDAGIALDRGFQERYGIRVENIAGRGAEQYERLKLEKRLGQMVADIWDGSALFGLSIKKAGAMVRPPDLPVFKEKDVFRFNLSALDPDKTLVLLTLNVSGWAVNTRLVKPEDEPGSWSDSLRPQWTGKIAFPDPKLVSSSYMAFLPLMNKGILEKDYVDRLGKQKLSMFRGSLEVARAVATGEYPLGLATDSYLAPFATEGAPVKSLSMKEGTIGTSSVIALIDGGPHPNAAALYMNYVLSREGQGRYAAARKHISLRKDVPGQQPAALGVTNVAPITAEELNDAQESFIKGLWVDKLGGK